MSQHSNPNFFYALETLRGVAAITVAIFHFLHNFGGHLAVDFFLILSGFVLAHNYLYKDRMQIWWFTKQRFYRLYPLHLFTLLTFAGAFYLYFNTLPNYPDGRWETLIQQFLLVQNVGLSPSQLSWNYPSWSISVEFIIGIVFVLFIRKSTWNSVLFIVAVICFYLLYHYAAPHLNLHRQNIFNYYNQGLIRGLGSFLLGILVYRAYRFILRQPGYKTWVSQLKARRSTYFLSSMLELVLIALAVILMVYRPHKYYVTDYLGPILFSIMIWVYAFEVGFISRILKKLQYLGEISYSIYLNQVTLLLLLAWGLEQTGLRPEHAMRNLYRDGYQYATGQGIVLIAFLIILVFYSHLTYRYVENPIRLWIKRRQNT